MGARGRRIPYSLCSVLTRDAGTPTTRQRRFLVFSGCKWRNTFSTHVDLQTYIFRQQERRCVEGASQAEFNAPGPLFSYAHPLPRTPN